MRSPRAPHARAAGCRVRLHPGETLRYRKHSEWSTSVGLAGMMHPPARYRRDSRFAITYTGDGRARAWIESVRLEARGDTGRPTVEIGGADVVGLPFILALGPRGSDSTVSRPRFSLDWSEMAGQFNGFFPRLPGGPLAPGREWTDTGTNEVQDSNFVTLTSRFATYRATGTGRVRGHDVVVVEYHSTTISDERWRRPPPEGMYPYGGSGTVSHTESRVDGTFYFAPRSGRLVRHTWTSETSNSRPSGHVEAAEQETTARVTIDLIS
ncbi:MAG TPA: hypothetical protein VJT67_17805, partial [Longimicrobiaceae bacterium]|nr:hypothetical protein [Longimicrobiaceae bacterium]